MRKLFVLALLASFSLNANALSILLSGGNSERDVTDRLIELGHTVTKANAAWYHDDWDYSPYDVVAFQYATADAADMNHLVAQVQAGNVGVVFFRSWGADETAQALGMSGGEFNWQYANQFNVVDNGHYITDGVATGQYDLGYTYMTSSPNPGADTTVLATGSDAAALIVHNTWRVAITPFYGHVDGWDDESILATQITERTLQWAAGASVVPLPAAVWLFGSALAGLGWLRRKPV